MAAPPPPSPELQALIDEAKALDRKPEVQRGKVDNPLRSPTVQELLRQQMADTAPGAAGRSAANALAGGFGPSILPLLQQYLEQPARAVASAGRQAVGASPLPDVPVDTKEGLEAQLADDRSRHPLATALGAGGVEGARTVAGASMAPLAIPAAAGAGIVPRILSLTAGGLPGSIGKRTGEVARGEKTSGQAASDIGLDTLINAGSSILGPLGKFGAGGRIAASTPKPYSAADQEAALQLSKLGIPAMPKARQAWMNEEANAGPGVFTGVGTAAKEAYRPYATGAGLVGEGIAHAAGIPYGISTGIGTATPSVIAALKQLGQNVGSRSASQALGMLTQNPALVLKLAGNPTLYQQALEALMSGTASELAAP